MTWTWMARGLPKGGWSGILSRFVFLDPYSVLSTFIMEGHREVHHSEVHLHNFPDLYVLCPLLSEK